MVGEVKANARVSVCVSRKDIAMALNNSCSLVSCSDTHMTLRVTYSPRLRVIVCDI